MQPLWIPDTMSTTISIIIPLYNKAPYIEDTIRSVLSQTFTDWEMLIIDNGSTDSGFEKARQIKDPRIVFLQCPEKGPSSARNLGIKNAKGKWIQFLDADDLLETTHFERQLETSLQNPSADIIVSNWQEFSDLNPENKALRQLNETEKTPENLRDSAVAFAIWPPHVAIIRHSVLTQNYFWPEELNSYLAEDVSFWFRLVTNFTVAYNAHAGATYRTQTPGARTDLRPEQWFEGVHKAVECNLSYIKENHLNLTIGQYENLARLFESIYILAYKKHSPDIQSKSITEADYWLDQYMKHTSKPKLSMTLRHLLGIKLFQVLIKIPNYFPAFARNFLFSLIYGFKGAPFHIGDHAIYLDVSLRRWNINIESAAHAALREHLKEGDVFIDVGANFGLHTIYAACLVGCKGHVFAFEPYSPAFKLLARNITLNKMKRQITVIPAALSNTSDRFLRFYVPPHDASGLTASLKSNLPDSKITHVLNMRLDDYWNKTNLPIKLIKIDVEGAELEVLRGAKGSLERFKPVLIIEVHSFALPDFGSTVEEMRNFLKELGYIETMLEGEQFKTNDYFQALYK